MSKRARIAIIGAGFIGRSWATLFAQHGHSVTIYDSDITALNQFHDALCTSLDELSDAGLLARPRLEILESITLQSCLAAAVSNADYVQENAPERLDTKRALFAELDRIAPPTAVLASSSSSLTCTQMCAELPGRARCVVAHPANPPHLLRAVEIVPASFTAKETVTQAAAIMQSVGQVPIVVGEIDGFVMNRLQAALAREALALIAAGIADATAVDAIVKHSLGPRWAFMGPFETMDLNAPLGFADYAQRYGGPFARLFGEPCWPPEAVTAVDQSMRDRYAADALPERREWRDRRLTALIAHLRSQP